MQISKERPGDAAAIRALTEAAFQGVPRSEQTEGKIIDALRMAGALNRSFIAVEDGEIVGHVAFSRVSINDEEGRWFGLGPISVKPSRQRRGIGQALGRAGLRHLEARGDTGCVVFGSPTYYARFGFKSDPRLVYEHAPPGYLQYVLFDGRAPTGEVVYHPAFAVT